MSDRKSTRNPEQFDYKIYAKTGKKVAKERQALTKIEEKFQRLSVMATEKLIDDERKICLKIDRLIDEYDFELLFSIEEIETGILEFKTLIDNYEEIHVELGRELGDNYENSYGDFKKKLKNMTTWVRNAKLEIKRRKLEKEEKEELLRKEKEEKEELLRKEKQQEELARMEVNKKREREKLKTEEKYFTERMKEELSLISDKSNYFVEDLEKHITDIKELKKCYFELFVKIENTFGDEFKTEYEGVFAKQNEILNTCISDLTNEISHKKLEEVKLKNDNDQLKFLQEEKAQTRELEGKIETFNGIVENITERATLLKTKCEISFDSFSDSQVLDKVSGTKVIDSDYNDILDWITELTKVAPSNYDKTKNILDTVRKDKMNLKKLKDKYFEKLDGEVDKRDLGSEKLSNVSDLKLDVPKFRGYGSTLDYYSFKSEFEKLVSPRIRAKFLPDYLKNNYLEGQALEIVREIDQIEKIWERLQSSFGNVEILLNNKLSEIMKSGQLWKVKSDEKLVELLTKLINGMKELNDLAEKHKIEEKLFHSSNLVKVYDLIGRRRQIKFMERNLGKEMSVKEEWGGIISFLDFEQKLKEKVLLLDKSKCEKTCDNEKRKAYNCVPESKTAKCVLCGKMNHVATLTRKGKLVVNYFACPKFAEMSPNKRLAELRSKGLCYQCLTPGLKKGHDGSCFNKFNCPNEIHQNFDTCYHVLVCDKHKNDPQNLKLLEEYKSKHITESNRNYKDFSKNIAISLHVGPELSQSYGANNDASSGQEINDVAIYLLQTIEIEGKKFNLFFDSGCSDLVSQKDAIISLQSMGRASKLVDGPITISGVGDQKTVCEHGAYTIKLPLANGKDACMSGLCLDNVTSEFPMYPLKEVENDIIRDFKSKRRGKSKKLPKLPHFVGGVTHFMVGIQFLKYHPKKIYELGNGLAIYQSPFLSHDGSQGVIGGPHKVFTEMQKKLGNNAMSAYLSETVHIYKNAFKLSLDVPLLGFKEMDLKFLSESRDYDDYSESETFEIKQLTSSSEPLDNDDYSESERFKNAQLENSSEPLDNDDYSESKRFKNKNAQFKNSSEPLENVKSVSHNDDYSEHETFENEKLRHNSKFSGSTLQKPRDNDVLTESEAYLKRKPLKVKIFEEAELAGTEVSFRCVRCRVCSDCKNSEKTDCISIQEEIEQILIEKSVTVDITLGKTKARLPFLCDPCSKLVSNKREARRIFDSQIKKLNNYPIDMQDVIASEGKLQGLGHVDYFENLTFEQKNKILCNPVNYYIPWKAVWNTNSSSTPCRLVYDASHPTKTGFSLNSVLPKGRNNMNKLVEICIRWSIKRHAFHTDIRKMYNTVELDENDWCYQMYLWEKDLDPKNEPKAKVIKTVIYGVKCSGNQAERGIRETGNLMKEDYPRVNQIIHEDTYVDDCMSGEDTYDRVCVVTDNLKLVLNKGGFHLKGFTFSGFDPPEQLANEEKSINVAGMKWHSKSDLLSLNIGELNFGKKCRGKKVENLKGLIPDKFTRRDCASKVAEIFDLLGMFTPIIAGFKLDLRELTLRSLDWNDCVPDDLKNIWLENFELIKKLGEVKFRRAVVPDDAISLDLETIEMGDASENLACAAIYVRFKRKNGSYSCQLLFGKSKIIPTNMTMPRAELFAALLNASTGHVAYSALKKYIKSRIHLTDSQIVLFWINNTKNQLKQYVRGRVIEIVRLTERVNWFYVDSANMFADIGTRKGAKLEDVLENSVWRNGHDWAKLDRNHFPIKSVHEIKLGGDNVKLYNDESLVLNDKWISTQLNFEYSLSYPAKNEGMLNNVSERYKFSQYVIDPNRFRFRKVVRILALVILFIRNLRLRRNKVSQITCISENSMPLQFQNCNDMYLITQQKDQKCAFPFYCKKGLVVCVDNDLLMTSLNYFYKKATLEVQRFLPETQFKNISRERDGILYYTGRILPCQEFNDQLNLSDVCIDLTKSSFCVPIIEKFSPLAFALVNEVHWYNYDAKHAGNETVRRYVESIAHIIEGRSLVKQFKRECARCKILNKKAVDVAMGPICESNLCIAPAFYVSQIDIFGPFVSYSNVNKRASVKIWFTIFCCCTTGAVDIKLMEDYSTTSFILAFVRFACKVGYPKKLLPDAGSQLVKGCEIMSLKFTDIKNRLYEEYGVQFETCPVGSHYVHGKVERKIRHVRESFSKCLNKERLSVIQWETLGNQIANSINNQPIALGNEVSDLEHLDILTPNRLMLSRNNDRSPVCALEITEDPKRIIAANNDLLKTWFKCWLVSCVPKLMMQPKWFDSSRDCKVGDVVLFLKSDREFDRQYQYGIIVDVKVSRDGKIRVVEIEYQNFTEGVKRRTSRGVREIIVVHPVDDIGIIRELNTIS